MRRLPIAVLCAAVLLSACEPIDTSALREIKETAAAARNTADNLSARTDEMQRALEDPVGALRTAALGATFTKTATAEPNIFVLTDLQTGCQWLATYGADGAASSMAPRTEQSGGATRQRCVSVSGLGGAEAEPVQEG